MDERIPRCPNCGAPVTPPSKWARSTVCAHCLATVLLDPHAISAEPYREAARTWEAQDAPSIGDAHYAFGGLIARGARCDVYLAERARYPTERVVVKILREESDRQRLDHEWQVLSSIAERSSLTLAERVPVPVRRGAVRTGPLDGRQALVLRWAPGFVRSLEQARTALPGGIPPVVAIWMWRRALEVIAAVHRLGWAHGALSPEHMLFHENEHGLRVVGWADATPAGDRAGASDVIASARAILSVVGEPIPAPFGALLREVAGGRARDAWALREELGTVAEAAFGAPGFHPLRLG